jgi:aldose 1-epimerase
MVMTGRQYEISLGGQWAVITEVGAQLRGYRVDGRDVTHVNDADELPPKSSGAVLMPWPNRIRRGKYSFAGVDQQLALSEPALGNASHGLAAWARWSVDQRTADEVRLHCDVVAQRGWPFELRTQMSYRLDPHLGLVVTMGAENQGRSAFPFGAGCHPYVSLGETPLEDAVVTVPAATRLETDDAQIPVRAVAVEGTDWDLRSGRRLGDLRLDTAYTDLAADEGGTVRVQVRAGDVTTTVWMDFPSFQVTQLFTLPELGGGGAAIAVESMTCPANAFNSGDHLQVLEPGGSWSGRWGITPSL